MMENRIISRQIGLLVISACSTPALVHAQEASRLPEIVVTAQKRSESIQKVPIAITAIPQQVLQERNLQSISDIASSLPGVKFSEFSASGNVSVRGVGTTIVSGAGEGSIATHVDGVYLSQTQSLTMVQSDLARVEVLRGPQSTLYGRNSTGGVINFISASPTPDFGGQISLLYGNYDRKQASGYVNAPLTEDVGLRVSGQYQKRDGWTKNTVTGQNLEDLESYGGRVALDADVSPAWNMQIRGSLAKEKFAGPVYDGFYPAFAILPAPLTNFDPREVSSPVIYGSSKRLGLISLRNKFDLGGVDLTSVTGYVDFHQNGTFDSIGAMISVPLTRAQTNRDFSQELNLSGKFGNLDWLAGLYYYQSKMDSTSFTALSNLGLADNIIIQKSTRRSYSAFMDGTFHVTDQFRIYGGVRVVKEVFDNHLDNRDGAGNVICSFGNVQKFRDTAFSGRAGVQYDVASGSMIYGQYSRGYKSGGFSTSSCNNPIKPETVDTLEAGLKTQLPDGLGLVNAAMFYYGIHNLQLEQATPLGIPVINVPESTVFGVELSATIKPVSTAQLDIAVTYLDAHYKDFINGDPLLGVPAGVNLAGIALNNSPKWSATIGAENDFAFSDDVRLKIRGELVLSSKYNVREFNTPYTIQGGYTMVNAFATLQLADNRYSIRAFGKNLTNKTLLAGVLGFGGALGSFQPPRTYGVEVTAKF